MNAQSAAGRLVRALLAAEEGELIVSQAIVDELAEVLARPKFSGRIGTVARRDFVLLMQATASLVEPVERVRVCRDPADDMILEAASAAAQAAVGRSSSCPTIGIC